MSFRINNPGGGDCGFYAFAIGLIHVIQQEYYSHGHSKTFNRWKKEGLGMNLQDILAIDLDWLACLPYNYKKDQLIALQMSLRNITVNVNKEDLLNRIYIELTSNEAQTKIEGSIVYGKFMELVQFYLRRHSGLEQISQYNELALSPEVLQLAQNTARSLRPILRGQPFDKAQKIENAYVKEALLIDVLSINGRNPHSVILNGIEQIKQRGRWATHSDLNEIADRLKVNLHVEGQVNGTPTPGYPTITLNNEGNTHWTTTVEQLFEHKPRELAVKRVAEQTELVTHRKHQKTDHETGTPPLKIKRVIETPEENYKKHLDNLFDATKNQRFFNTPIKSKINVNSIDNARAAPKESDQSFATRLQEAELRRILID
ncbi:hypothetical protein [Legionella cincinnatiensis]|uniref:Dot/Icm T4SS effector n=1 Tax=Legionella cincinnatiensis TaxID=28085 RepID=A0A378IGR9_9GAMM|nr:hypothetical protein [Legionella cincinnatiensis]KTC83602.1 Dot/Icm T4SS effector [Legionella cincinnatiensis]STX34438.1 Dot/Icm T4SS effector [Legionella cincinnatiensis]